MDKLPFTVYDFFGHLSAGFVVLVAVTAAFVGYEPLKESPNAILGIFFAVATYVVGHMVANISGDLIERRLVRQRLGLPTAHLLDAAASQPAKRLLPGYYRSLPEATCDRVVTKAAAAGVTGKDEALFLHCHARMKSDEAVQTRLNTFLNLYGFCRNMAMALVLAALALGGGLLIGSAETGPDVGPGWWLGAAVLAAVGMLYRYLKFFRQYGFELFTSYAEKD